MPDDTRIKRIMGVEFATLKLHLSLAGQLSELNASLHIYTYFAFTAQLAEPF